MSSTTSAKNSMGTVFTSESTASNTISAKASTAISNATSQQVSGAQEFTWTTSGIIVLGAAVSYSSYKIYHQGISGYLKSVYNAYQWVWSCVLPFPTHNMNSKLNKSLHDQNKNIQSNQNKKQQTYNNKGKILSRVPRHNKRELENMNQERALSRLKKTKKNERSLKHSRQRELLHLDIKNNGVQEEKLCGIAQELRKVHDKMADLNMKWKKRLSKTLN